ncbi:hypothetical protein Fmac_032033 [Flemingia macrophylla]|uniref:Aminotransferase-like plant mobile domain-containing protein n=1 Tax=Flemingia macrophylla TaxID=520843 RepID=A0ABD1L3Q8_9FABA
MKQLQLLLAGTYLNKREGKRREKGVSQNGLRDNVCHTSLAGPSARHGRPCHLVHFAKRVHYTLAAVPPCLIRDRQHFWIISFGPYRFRVGESELVVQCFGLTPPPEAFKDGYSLRLSWLAQYFGHPDPNVQDPVYWQRHARAWICRFLGGVLFVDVGSTYVNIRWLTYLRDVRAIGNYAWGAAALSYLYRNLCRTTNSDTKNFGGFVALLQLWDWERIPKLRPIVIPPVDVAEPIGVRWTSQHHAMPVVDNVDVIRKTIDCLRRSDFIWCPYSVDVIDQLPEECRHGMDIWESICPLVSNLIIEWHQPDRVMRQFRFQQSIPHPPFKRHSFCFRTLWQSPSPDSDLISSRVIDDRNLLAPSPNSKTGLHILDLIDRGSLEPDRERCTQLGKLREGKLVHLHVLDSHFGNDLVIQNSVLFMYARCGNLEDARRVLHKMPRRDMVTWTSMITGYAQNDRANDALVLFPRMLRDGAKPNEFTLSSLLESCGFVRRCGYLGESRLVFDKLGFKNEALALFVSMGCLEQGKWLHAHLMKSAWKLVGYVGNTLLDMYAKSGSIRDAKKVFEKLKVNVVSFNSMLIGYAHHGLGKEAVPQFEEMIRVGIEPNDITFLSLLTACNHARLLDEGRHYFGLMRKNNIEPKVSHYVTIVDLLGLAGLLDQAKSFIEEMPIEPTGAI